MRVCQSHTQNPAIFCLEFYIFRIILKRNLPGFCNQYSCKVCHSILQSQNKKDISLVDSRKSLTSCKEISPALHAELNFQLVFTLICLKFFPFKPLIKTASLDVLFEANWFGE